MKIKVFLLSLALLCLCGCNATEPEARFTVTDLAFCKMNEVCAVYLRATDPEKGQFTLKGVGESFEGALMDVDTKLSRSPSFSHCEIIIFSAGAEGNSINEILKCLDSRRVPIRAKVLYCQEPEELFFSKSEQGTNLGGMVGQTLRSFGFGGHTALYEIGTALLENNGDFALLNLDTDGVPQIIGLRRYRGSKIAESLNVEESVQYAKENKIYEGSDKE